MARIFGSYNSRYFAVHHPDEQFSLFRGPQPLWTRPVPGMEEVLRLANNGDAWFRSPDGVYRLAHHRDAGLEPLEAACHLAAGDEEGGRLGRAMVSVEGTEVALERIVPEARLSRKLLKMLRRGEGEEENMAEAHEVLVMNRATGQLRKFFKGLVDPERGQRFLWQMSPHFTFLVTGVPEKKGTFLFRVVHIKEETVYSEFDMKFTEYGGIFVTDQGTVMLDVRVSPEENYLVIATLDGEKHILRPPEGAEVRYLGHRILAMKTSPVPFILVKNFEDALACHADLRPLDRLGMEYELLFNERGDIDVVMYRDGEIRVHHTDVENLAVDARRWDLLAQQQEMAEMHEEKQQAEREAQEESRRQRSEAISQQLAEAIPARPLSFAAEADDDLGVPRRTRAEVESAMEKLRMAYVSGSVEREEYLRRNEELALELESAAEPGGPAPVSERSVERLEVPSVELAVKPQPTPLPEPAPVARREAPKGPELAWSMPEAMPAIKRFDPKEFERQKIERLLESLEERLMLGEVSEETYRTLKEKYLKRLANAG